MSDDPSNQYWYNMKTGEVERGLKANSMNRVGPFATADEASHALEKLRENSEKWAADDAADQA